MSENLLCRLGLHWFGKWRYAASCKEQRVCKRRGCQEIQTRDAHIWGDIDYGWTGHVCTVCGKDEFEPPSEEEWERISREIKRDRDPGWPGYGGKSTWPPD
jgi:hypothetical protein